MDKTEMKEYVAQIKGKIEDFDCDDEQFEAGFAAGLMWCMYLLEEGKRNADEKVKLPKRADCDCKECGC